MATERYNRVELTSGMTTFEGTESATPKAQKAGVTKRKLLTPPPSETSTWADEASTLGTETTHVSTRASTRAYSKRRKDSPSDESPSDSPEDSSSHNTDPETSSSDSTGSRGSRENTGEREIGAQFKGAHQVHTPRRPRPVIQIDGEEAVASPRIRRVLRYRDENAVVKTGPRKRKTVVHNPSSEGFEGPPRAGPFSAQQGRGRRSNPFPPPQVNEEEDSLHTADRRTA